MGKDRRTFPRPGDLHWFTSTRTDGERGNCVEVAWTSDALLLRDSRDRSGPTLRIPAAAWTVFLSGLRRGEFP